MKKRLFALLLTGILATSMLVGCGGSDSGSKDDAAGKNETSDNNEASNPDAGADADNAEKTTDKVTLRMSYWNSEDTMAALLDYLAEAVPEVEIEYQFIDNDNYNTVVDTQLSAEEGPDIICESPGSALKHAKLGYLKPINELGARYSAAGTNVYSYNGVVYALPGISWFEGIWFNKDLFEDNNIALPTTFDEYIAVCKQFKSLGIKPLAAGLMSWEPMLKNSMAFVTAEYLSTDAGKDFGGQYREGNAKMQGTWNPYIEKWSETFKEGIYTSDMLGIDHAQAMDEFATGTAAMFCSGPWDYEAIMAKNPDLNLDMMPFYGTTASDGWLIGGPGCGFAVNANSEHADLAVKVLDALSTVEGQKALWENNQGGSSYLNGAEFDLPEVYNSASSALNAGNVYCPWNEWGEAAPAHENYGLEFQAYLDGQDLDTTLGNVDAAVEELLSK